MQNRALGLRRTHAKWAATAVMFSALAGCTGTVSDDVSLQEVQSRGEAIVIVAATFPGRRICSDLILTVRRKAEGKDRLESFTASSLFRGDSPAQAKLDAGSYELANMTCISGNVRVVLTKGRDIFSSKKAGPPPVYGRFSVKPGEVVNLGHISVKWAVAGIAQTAVADLSPKHHAWLKENRPNLSSRMVTRLMQGTRHKVIKRKAQ